MKSASAPSRGSIRLGNQARGERARVERAVSSTTSRPPRRARRGSARAPPVPSAPVPRIRCRAHAEQRRGGVEQAPRLLVGAGSAALRQHRATGGAATIPAKPRSISAPRPIRQGRDAPSARARAQRASPPGMASVADARLDARSRRRPSAARRPRRRRPRQALPVERQTPSTGRRRHARPATAATCAVMLHAYASAARGRRAERESSTEEIGMQVVGHRSGLTSSTPQMCRRSRRSASSRRCRGRRCGARETPRRRA